ncbi:hypothetical protein HY086_04825 [Candidatus Gottesmanbacteria bacterium]|nr:hypothetical protein [Candidatus Gottesmanbacteria bacterium]
MQTQTITQLGNSDAVVLPSPVMREAKWRRGEKITVNYIHEADGVFIRRVKKESPYKRSEKEFQSWLDNFLKEDADVLDELAHR